MSFPSSIIVLRYPEAVVENTVKTCWKLYRQSDDTMDEKATVSAVREALRRLQPVVTLPPDKRLQMAFKNFDTENTGRLGYHAFRQIVVQYHDYHAGRNEQKYREYLDAKDLDKIERKVMVKGDETTKARGTPVPSLDERLPRGGKWDLVSDIAFPVHRAIDVRDVYKDYSISRETLGEGSFGKVSLAVHRQTGARRVVKTIDLTSPQQAALIKEEVELMKRLNHPNILRLHETYHCGYRIFLILELCEGGPLYDRLADASLGGLKEGQLALWMQQILSAVSFCHDRNVVHRDIKPENILFVSKSPDSPLKVIDFGLSSTMQRIRELAGIGKERGIGGALAKIMGSQNRKAKPRMQCAGTPHYMAPEMIKGQYDEKCDIFSVGVILYQMLSGRHPFFVSGLDDRDTVRVKILQDNPSTDTIEWEPISREAKQLVQWMLQKEPKKRCSAREALTHVWVARAGRSERELTPSVFQGLREWQGQNKLRQAVCVLLAQDMGESQISELRQKFQAFDRNGDGTITLEEFRHAIQNAGIKMDDEEVSRVFHSLDRSETKVIFYTEFVSALLARRVQIEDSQLRNVFEKLDVTREGRISVVDLHKALKGSRRGHLTESETLQHFLKADINNDGYIDFEEFAEFMRAS